MSDEQLINVILKSTIKKYAVEIGVTGYHLECELKKRGIQLSVLRLRQLPSDFDYEGVSLRELSKKYSVDRKVIKRWIKEYNKKGVK